MKSTDNAKLRSCHVRTRSYFLPSSVNSWDGLPMQSNTISTRTVIGIVLLDGLIGKPLLTGAPTRMSKRCAGSLCGSSIHNATCRLPCCHGLFDQDVKRVGNAKICPWLCAERPARGLRPCQDKGTICNGFSTAPHGC